MVRVVIVDDERHCCDNLQWLLRDNFPDIEIVAVNYSADNALQQIASRLIQFKHKNNPSFQRIALPTLHGYELVPIANIMVCESNSNYTDIRLNDGRHFLISRTLKEMEEILNSPPFLRVHNSFLVNFDYVVRYVKGEGGHLVLNNEISVPVSRNKKEELLKLITNLSA